MNSCHIVHSRGYGVEVRIPRHADAGMERAIEIDLLVAFLIFEVPILGPRMRGLPRYFYFLMFFKRTSNMRNTTCSSILVGLRSELFALPSDTLSQQ